MNRRLVRSSFAVLAALACKGALEPNLTSRWASTGIQLVTTPIVGQLLLACNRPVQLPGGVRFDSQGRIQFSGTLTSFFSSYSFVFTGQVQGDTLMATMALSVPNGPVDRHFRLTPNGDPQWALIDCAM